MYIYFNVVFCVSDILTAPKCGICVAPYRIAFHVIE